MQIHVHKCRIRKRPKPFEDDRVRIPLVVFGGAIFPNTMKGMIAGIAGIVRRCVKLLKQAEYQGRLVLILIDEYKTSRICSNPECRCDALEKMPINSDNVDSTDKMYGVLRCQKCNIPWQRDFNAARNMHYTSTEVIVNRKWPAIFTRNHISTTAGPNLAVDNISNQVSTTTMTTTMTTSDKDHHDI